MMDTIRADDIIEVTLGNVNAEVSKILESDVIIIKSPMYMGIDDVIRDEIEAIKERKDEKENLCVIVETTGGYIEVVERIVRVFRRHYKKVSFIVPSFAYSAGTVLVLSGDDIYMDYYSVLGPVDPQLQFESDRLLPGMGYLAKYNELLEKINTVEEGKEGGVRAEIAFLLEKFDPATLFHIEQAIEHSTALIKEWLPKYKFKDWNLTEQRNLEVTDEYKEERARKIAEKLGDASHWHSHGRGISRADLEGDDIGLKIKDFGDNHELNGHVRHYYGLFIDYTQKMGYSSATHTSVRLRRA